MLTITVLKSPLDQVLFYHLDILLSHNWGSGDPEVGSAVHDGPAPFAGVEGCVLRLVCVPSNASVVVCLRRRSFLLGNPSMEILLSFSYWCYHNTKNTGHCP